MALTEHTEYQSITILADGQINVRRDRVIIDDTTGEELGRRPHRFVLEPGQDTTPLPSRVRQICATVWTPAVVADFIAARKAQQEKGPLGNK